MFSYNVLKQGKDVLLAICDENILGKTFSDGELEIFISDFYKGKSCGAADAIKLAKKATIINAVGKDIINILIEKKFVNASSILKIGETSHAQVITMG
ncbi:MAG TPA: DUF424 family protein [Candidatus Aenigmarchaeota archaeon]|nr:DUF424 family protein [Candidatus Aenigmarchaeota archaeon]